LASLDRFREQLKIVLNKLPGGRIVGTGGLAILCAASALALIPGPGQAIGAGLALGWLGAVGQNVVAGLLQQLYQEIWTLPDRSEAERFELLVQSIERRIRTDEELRREMGVFLGETEALAIAEEVATGNPAVHGWLLQAIYMDINAYRTDFDQLHVALNRIETRLAQITRRTQHPEITAERVRQAEQRLAALPLDEAPEPAALPAGSRMTLSRNPQFVGRVANLKALARALKGGETAVIGQIAAATGLGGIGKTQLASEFVHRYGRYFAGGVFWLSMAEPESVAAEVALCGGPNGLGLYTEASGLSLDEQVGMVRAAWQNPLPRLLVFDNCEEEALLAAWRPTSGGCRVLVTSRRGTWDRSLGVAALALGVLSRAESVALLGKFREDLLTAGGPPLVPPNGGEGLGAADEGEVGMESEGAVGGPPLVAKGEVVRIGSEGAVGGPPLVPPMGGRG